MTPLGDTILIVDDDPDIRDALAGVLAGEGYAVLSACDGQEALDLLSAGARPKAILLDLMMPRLSGFEFLQRAGTKLHQSGIRVVVVTAHLGSQAQNLGAFDLLPKPVDLDRLVSTVNRATAAA